MSERHFIAEVKFSENYILCGHPDCADLIIENPITNKDDLFSQAWRDHVRSVGQGDTRGRNAIAPSSMFNRSNGGKSQATPPTAGE